jgi:hypothetical protein
MVAQPWPIEYLKPRAATYHLAPRTTAGTVSTSGFTQRVSVPIHSWLITYENILVWTEEQIRVWDAYEAYLDGGATPILVPLFGYPGSTGADGTSTALHPVGSTTMTVHRTGGPIVAGHHFSVGERLYRTFGTSALGGDNYSFSIRPPLRDQIFVGTTLYFNDLQVRCRLATDDEMTLRQEPGRMGSATVRFVEDPSSD